MMKPPKEISKAKIPRKTIIISYAVIYATSLPMYSLAREATTLSWVLSYGFRHATNISFFLSQFNDFRQFICPYFFLLSHCLLCIFVFYHLMKIRIK